MYDFTTLHIINQYRNSYTNKENWIIKDNNIIIRNSITFTPDNVESVSKRKFEPTKKEQLTIDFSSLGSTVSPVYIGDNIPIYVGTGTRVNAVSFNQHVLYRICLKIKLEHSINPYYSDRAANKGIPVYIEFEIFPNDTVEAICDRIQKNIKKSDFSLFVNKDKETISDRKQVSLLGNGKLAEVFTNSLNQLVIRALDNEQRFEEFYVEEFREDLKIKKFVPIPNQIITKEEGSLGFGTYEQLINEVRLMSRENLTYKAIYNDELPLKNGKYSQYIITMKSPIRDKGISAVGERSKSLTRHVLWINDFAEATDLTKVLDTYK